MSEDRYYWLEGSCSRSEYELISYQMFEEGISSIQELDASNDETICFRVCDSSEDLINHIQKEHSSFITSKGSDENLDWDRSWREMQKAVVITDTLSIYPPWVERIPRENGIDILIEAKQAFGTGTHESTSLIIRLMEKVLTPGKNPWLLDIGTGTGILAMYAEKLCGAKTVVTEIDPVTVECIQENFELNGLGRAMGILGFLDAFKQRPSFDIVLCNMIRTELWPMRKEMVDLLNVGGLILISGQLALEKHHILDWFAADNFSVVKEEVDGEWWAVAARKN
jgi:ribosomal protein L11 methyltransferase